MPALSDLITALAAATGASLELDERLGVEVFGWTADRRPGRATTWRHGPGGLQLSVPAYTSSLDAITGAIEARWPGCVWRADSAGWDATIQLDWMQHGDVSESAQSSSACLALCLAAARLAAAEAADAR